MSLFQDLNVDSARSKEPPKKPTEAMKEAGVTRRRIDRHIYSNTIRGLVSANADIDELERMIDELED
jgi:hypothetical protein